MNDDYRSQFAKAVIADMNEALQDPQSSPAEHVTRHGAAASFQEDGTLEVAAAFGMAPSNVKVNAATMRVVGPAASPSVVWMRITTNANATMHLTDSAGAEHQVALDDEEQDTLNRYCTAALFQLTGIANGELTGMDMAGDTSLYDDQDLHLELTSLLRSARTIATDLGARYRTGNSHPGEIAEKNADALARVEEALATAAKADDECFIQRLRPDPDEE